MSPVIILPIQEGPRGRRRQRLQAAGIKEPTGESSQTRDPSRGKRPREEPPNTSKPPSATPGERGGGAWSRRSKTVPESTGRGGRWLPLEGKRSSWSRLAVLPKVGRGGRPVRAQLPQESDCRGRAGRLASREGGLRRGWRSGPGEDERRAWVAASQLQESCNWL